MTCPTCATAAEPGWSFCQGCGSAFSFAAVATVDAIIPDQGFSALDLGADAPVFGGYPQGHPSAVAPVASQATVPAFPAETVTPPMAGGIPPAGAVQPFATSYLAPRRRDWRHGLAPRAQAITAAMGVLVLAMLVFAAFTLKGDLSSTRASLSATRADLTSTRAELDTKVQALAASEASLSKTQGTLDTTQAELDKLKSELGTTRSSLEGARDTVDMQESQISDLKVCLDGVSSALTNVAEGYLDSAIGNLEAVSSTCRRARSNV